jgi:hypothetical protein
MNSYIRPSGAVDPTQWMITLGNAWMPTGVVLPLVGLSFLLLSLSWILTKPPHHKIEEQNKSCEATGDNVPS